MSECVIPYTCRPAFVPFHQRTERDAVLVCHRRAGKTVCLVVELILRALANQRKHPAPQYAFFYPTWKRAKDIAWPYLKYYSRPIPGVIVKEGDLSIQMPHGPKITLYGAANSRGVGLYLDGVVYDEVDEIPQAVTSPFGLQGMGGVCWDAQRALQPMETAREGHHRAESLHAAATCRAEWHIAG